MNILHFVARYSADNLTQDVHEDFLRLLKARGHRVQVLAVVRKADRPRVAIDEAENGIQIHRALTDASFSNRLLNLISKLTFRYPYFLSLLLGYKAYLDAHSELDVIHVESVYPFGAMAALVDAWRHWRGQKAPRICTALHGADVLKGEAVDYGYMRFRLPRALLPFTFRRMTWIRANSNVTCEAAKRLGAKPERITVIPQPAGAEMYLPAGADLAAFRAASRGEIDARYATAGRFLVVSLGRLHPFKGYEYLIRAAAELGESVPATFLIAGPGRWTEHYKDYRGYLETLARECGVSDRVKLIGEVPHDEAQKLLAAADALAVPSVLEAMSRVVIEAAAVGTPVIVTRTTGMSEYVSRAGAGLVIDPQNPAAIAAACRALAADASRRAETGARGRAIADELRGELMNEKWAGYLERAA